MDGSGLTSNRKRRDESGAVTLIELVIASGLAMVLIAMVGTLGYQIERFITQQNASFTAETGAMRNLSVALDNLSNGAQSGSCISPGPNTPLGQCTHVSSSGPVVEAASGSGFCFYAYPATGAGLVPPSLDCVVAYPDSSGSGQNLYSVTYSPVSGATYTNCDIATCFGNEAPAAGTLPAQPDSATCSGQCDAKLVGSIDSAAAPFSYASQSGAVSVGSTPTPQALAAIETVTVTAPVQVGTFGQQKQITYTHSASVSGNAYAQEESWSAIS